MLTLQDLAHIARAHPAAPASRVSPFEIGGRLFDFNAVPSIMGVVNLSADSWYRESVCLTVETAVERGLVLAAQGAVIIDIGAESTLSQAARVDADTQTGKLIPVVRALAGRGVLVSVETYEPSVAKACLEAGAKVINLTGFEQVGAIHRLVSEHEAALILCHVQGQNVREVGDFDLNDDPIPVLYEYFARVTEAATKAGVTRLFIDPGLGFYYRNLQDSSVRIRHQMKTFLNTFRLRELGFPVCHALPHAFECFREEVRSAEPFFAVLAALGGTDLFRTHEVARTRAVLDTLKVY